MLASSMFDILGSPWEMTSCVSYNVLTSVPRLRRCGSRTYCLASFNNKIVANRSARSLRSMSRFGSAGDIVLKRMTVPSLFIELNVGTILPLTTYESSLVQSSPASEWASFAARYQQYRVKSMALIGKACHPTCDTVVANHSSLYQSDFIGSSAPTSAAQVLSDEGAKQTNTSKDFVVSVTWARNSNAKLWNPTSAAIPTANLIGLAIASNPSIPVGTAAGLMYALSLEFEVEFRGSQ